jgi:hypothetical protein
MSHVHRIKPDIIQGKLLTEASGQTLLPHLANDFASAYKTGKYGASKKADVRHRTLNKSNISPTLRGCFKSRKMSKKAHTV